MNVNEIVRQISTDFQNPWIIFNASELKKKTIIPIERWGWNKVGNDRIERNLRTSGHPMHHRREVLDYNGEWVTDSKTDWGLFVPDYYITDVVELQPRKVDYFYTLSPHLQNLITQTILQPRNPANLVELQTKIQGVCFVRAMKRHPGNLWLVFNKQWLYEQITNPNPDEDFFIIQGLPSRAKKEDTELKQFLQQGGYLPADWNSSQGSENHSQNNNNTFSNPGNTAYPSSTSSSNNYNSTFANSDSENYSSDSYASSSSYSSSTSDSDTYHNSATSTASEVNEDKSDSHSNSSSPGNSSGNLSFSSSDSSGYTGNFSNGGEDSGKNNSATTTSNKPKNPESSQPTFEQKKPAFSSPKPSSPNNLTNQDELTKQKQQIIQEIKEKLAQIPNLNLPDEVANWKQEIEQMQNLEAIKSCQKNLLEKIEKDKQLKQGAEGYSLETRSKEKNIIPWVAIGSILVGGVVFMAFYLKSKKRNQ